jgi:nuclear pore complex protein Nup155
VEWCLVVTTKEEAMICALARKDFKLTAVPTKFVIPSDWISFVSVTATKAGRVFLGGQDGNLYELDYDLLIQSQNNGMRLDDAQAVLDNFYDGTTGLCPAQIAETATQTPSILTSGKRVIDMIRNPSGQPPRKCRKLNHTQSVLSAYVPELVSKFTSAVFGDPTTTGGGPIIDMTVDEERQVLYTLSTRGWICALDIAETPQITLTAVLNTPSTARLYLEAVSRGRVYAPTTSSAIDGNLVFPGGGEAAQAGVGGMDGARRILKMAEQLKSNRLQRPIPSVLTPVAIEVVPVRESTRITLVAITASGIRYYLSSLSPNTLGLGPAPQPFETPRHLQSVKPHTKMTLCHIRAPPSLSDADASMPSHWPMQPMDHTVDAVCYRDGVFFAAFNKMIPPTGAPPNTGNILVATSPDSKARVTQETQKENLAPSVTYVTPGGVCESVSFPSARNDISPSSAILPGGRIWAICIGNTTQDPLVSLAVRSKTPTDTELGFSIAPAYVPHSKRGVGNELKSVNSSTALTTTHPSISSLAIKVFTNLLLSRPAKYGIEPQRVKASTSQEHSMPVYRVSKRAGTDGFSLSAADTKSSSGVGPTRSARLSPWLLTPEVVQLSPMALEYLEPPTSTVLALNAGGLHQFQSPSILQQLASAILSAGEIARTDPSVTKFFESYGYSEGCAMCLFLAMKPSSSNDLKEFALRAALARAYRPNLVASSSTEQQSTVDPWVPVGYVFSPSALYEGLSIAVARLLRPFWNKPAVVVTEGRTVRRGSKAVTSPAKVELLLDDNVDQLRAPLDSMQRVISRVFAKAVRNVPVSRSSSADTDGMDVDQDQHLLTTALEFQRRGQGDTNVTGLRPVDAEKLAEQIEERNIHSLFRLLSRTAQLLRLISHLRRAHSMPDLPEVEWGQLHGISIAQLVESREGQYRLETTLNSLVTAVASRSMPSSVSADAKEIARILSEQCYHFFSPGSRYAYFGFQSAQDALNSPPEQRSRRMALTVEAVENLKNAAQHWFSPSLITGRTLQNSDVESYERLAERARQCDSPLAKACDVLIELESVPAVVEICLLTASNFRNIASSAVELAPWRNPNKEYHWEKALYHRRHIPSRGASSLDITGTTVTNDDAIKTCHGLVFYHLSRLLNSPVNTRMYQLGERMVSVCASSADMLFLKQFFEHLLDSDHVDVLLRIHSPELENWLLTEKKDNLELLLKYYQIQDEHSKAGKVAWKYATETDVNRVFSKRVEFLIQAVDAFTRARDHSDGDLVGLNAGNERLSIARLQGRISQAIAATKYETSPEVLAPLESQLLTANDLINKYAMPYELYDCCLLLLHACRYNNVSEIERFWKSLLCDEIFPCSTRNEQTYHWLRGFVEGTHLENPTLQLLCGQDPATGVMFEDGTWMSSVEGTVIRLGEEIFASSDSNAFPVEFVTRCLEGT